MSSIDIESFIGFCFIEERLIDLKMLVRDGFLREEELGPGGISICQLFGEYLMDCDGTAVVLSGGGVTVE